MVELKGDERLDYLLAEFKDHPEPISVLFFIRCRFIIKVRKCTDPKRENRRSLLSGNGVIPLLLSTRTKGTITGVEIQERLYDMAKRSMDYNGVTSQIEMIHGDIKEIPKQIGYSKYDVVTCNPPYFPTPSIEEMNKNEHFAIARHEIMCNLEDVMRVSSQLLRQGGKAAFVHRPGRLMDILHL